MNARNIICYFVLFSSFISHGQLDTNNFKKPIQEIDEVVISSNLKQIAFEDSKYFIVDFEVNELGYFLLLKNMRNYQLYRLDQYLEPQSSLPLKFKPTALFSDCLGNLHILAKDSIYQINTLDESLSIFEQNSIELYHSFFKNCVGQSGDYVIMENIYNFGKSKVFYAFNRNEPEEKIIYRIEDSVAVADVNLEYRGILANDYLGRQRTGEISIEQLGNSRDHAERIFYFDQILSQSDYNPLFVKNDTSYIFDHINGYAIQVADSGTILNKTSITYQNNEDWAKINHHDAQNNTFYTVYENKGTQHFYELSTENYELGKRTKITEHAYPKKLIVYDGYVYYTYKENYAANLNKLYRHKL